MTRRDYALLAGILLLAAATVVCGENERAAADSEAETGDRKKSSTGRKSLSEKEQREFLASRTKNGVTIGTFSAYASLLFAGQDVIIAADDEKLCETELHPLFMDDYKPTWAELFDCIARQTRSTWKYDARSTCWIFSATESVPFSVDVPTGWTWQDHGEHVTFKPAGAAKVMDVHCLGRHSFASEKKKNLAKVREFYALRFAQAIDPKAELENMQEVRVADAKALYYESPAPKPGFTWRQWIFLKDTQAIAIVCSIPSVSEKSLLKDVKAMVETFKLPE